MMGEEGRKELINDTSATVELTSFLFRDVVVASGLGDFSSLGVGSVEGAVAALRSSLAFAASAAASILFFSAWETKQYNTE